MLTWITKRLWKLPWYRTVARKVAGYFGGDLYEHPMLAMHRTFVHSTLVAFLLSWGALVVGVWTALDQDRLQQSTKLGACIVWSTVTEPLRLWTASSSGADALANCAYPREMEISKAENSRGNVNNPAVRLTRRDVVWDWETTVFWLCLLAFTRALWARLRADDRKQDDRDLELQHAIHRCPDLNVLRYYPAWLSAFKTALFEDWPDGALPAAERREIIARNIRSAMLVVGGMARQFARAEGARYGANVMMYLRNDPDNAGHFPASILNALRFHDASAVAGFEALLHLPGELLVADIDAEEKRLASPPDSIQLTLDVGSHSSSDGARGSDGATSVRRNGAPGSNANGAGEGARHVPLISLAVLRPNSATGEYDLVIPGAPAAVVHEDVCGLSVHQDTSKIANECADFDTRVRERIATYFSPQGEGGDIASFASWRIGPREDPLGVLNVDSDRKLVLGVSPEFYFTFSALVTPMLTLLETAVWEYRELFASAVSLPTGALEWERAEAAVPGGAAAAPAAERPETAETKP